ncbi:hypothetical protein SteCoe_25431 [Stentor coeruleus]|uniref:Uncharacterized protein n=1 Tax=Stentor coeruleus TaxID=5963 RepID=A0A1R2BFK4_9CILI|nr:hypothetical protein SteCoe_25431 [Stentor coeruleus]
MIKHKTSKSKNSKDHIKDTTQLTSTSFKLTQNKSSLQNASSYNNLLNIQKKPIPNTENLAVTKLTIDDITNNLCKSFCNDSQDLENVYEFLNTYTKTKGKSGFITINRPSPTRKNLSKSFKNYSESIDQSGVQIPKTTKSKPLLKSLNLPTSLSPKVSVRKMIKDDMKNIEGKMLKKKHKKKKEGKISVNKSEFSSPKNLVIGKNLDGSRTKREKRVGSKVEDTFKERILSPYAENVVCSEGRWPLLHSAKKRIKVLKYGKDNRKL